MKKNLKDITSNICTLLSIIILTTKVSFGQCPTGIGTISGTNSVCNLATSVSYTVSGFGGTISSYNWSVPSGVIITSGALTNIIIVSISGSAVSGTIKAFAINSTPCTLPSIAFNLTVNSLPTVSITGISNLCTGQTSLSIPFSNAINSPNQYYVDWNSAANSVGFIDDAGWLSLTGSNMTINGIVSTVPAGNYNASIYVRNSTTGCQTDAANPSFCGTANENTTLSMASPSGRPFSSVNFASFGTPNGSCGSFTTSTCHAPISYSAIQSAAVGQSSFSLAATNGNFGGDPCSGTAKRLYVELVYPAFYLTMTPAVASITTSATTICSGFNTTLTASAGISYSWSPGGATSQSIVVSPASTQNYVVTITSSNPTCSTTGVNQTITVNPLPNLTSLTSAALVCYGANTLVLTYSSATNSPNQYSITWNASAHTAGLTDIGLTSFSSSPIIVPINTVTSGNYGASILVKNSTTGCQNTIYGLGTVCGTTLENTTLIMTAPGSSLFTAINFASFGTPNGTCGSFITSTCHAPISSSYVQGLALGTNSFSVGATNANFGGDPCSGTAKRLYIQAEYSGFTLTVNPVLSITSTLTPAAVCSGSTFSYAPASSITGATFNWVRPTVTGISNSSSTGTGSISEILINTTSNPVSVNYNYTTLSNGCTGNIQTVTVTSNPSLSTISGISGSSSVCNYQTGVTYSVASVPGATSYNWSVPSGIIITSGSTTNAITVSITGTSTGGNIIAKAINGCSTITSSLFNVTVNTVYSSPTTGMTTQYLFSNNGVDGIAGNTGSIQNSPVFVADRNSVATSALQVNGTTQYVVSSSTITFPTAFTMSIWIKTSASNYGGWIAGRESAQFSTGGSNDRKIYLDDNGYIKFGVWSGSVQLTTSTNKLNDNLWHHIVATNNTANGIKLYVDGVLNSTNGNYSTDGSTGYLKIGVGTNWGGGSGSSSNPNFYFNGSLDDFQMYNRELSASEVSLLYGVNSAIIPACNTLNLVGPTIAGVSYSWSGPNGFTSTAANPVITNLTTINSGFYNLTITNGACASPVFSTNIQTNSSPNSISGITGTNALCNYQTTVPYSIPVIAGATSYNWSVPSGMVITSGSTSNNITVSVSGIFSGGNIYANAINFCGTVTSAGFPVTANSLTSSLYSGELVNYPFNNSGSDNSGNSNNAILQGSPSYTTDRNGNTNSAINFNGTTSQYASSTNLITTAPTNYSFALWIKTSSTQGGKLVGYGSNPTGNSGSYDRHLYMTNSGQFILGNYSASAPNLQTATTPLSYNDGTWHHVAGTYSTTNGISIYVDGKLTATAASNGTYNYSGYWRIGGDNTGSWPSAPSSNYFNGAIDDFYIYNRELSYNEVQLLYGIFDNSPVCSSSNLVMNVATFTGASYAWTGPSSFTASTNTASVLGVSTVNSGIYNASISVAGCSLSYSKTITIDAGITNSITGAQNICIGLVPLDPLSGSASPANPAYTYYWELSTITGGLSGYLAAPGVNTGTGYTFITAINVNTYVRRTLTYNNCNYYSNILLMTATSPNLSAPNYYPTNAWNAYVYNAQGWPSAKYTGLWTVDGTNINVDTRTTLTGYGSWTNRPSDAISYVGCQVANTNYSIDVKRTGFNGGIYQIDMLAYDDDTYLLINGSLFWSDPSWYAGVPKYGVYVGPLTSTTSLQLRCENGGGPGGFAFNVFPTVPGALTGGTIGSNQSICPGNTPNPFINVALPSGGCSVSNYTWQYSNTNTITGWNDISSSNSSSYTYPISIGQITYFRRKATDICSSIAYSNIITVDNNFIPTIPPTVPGINGWNAFMYYDQNFGNYAGYFTMTGINATDFGFNTLNYFGNGAAPSSYAQYNGCSIGATNISGKFIRSGFTSGIYQLDITGHDDDAYVLVNGVQVFVHNGCCDTHSNVYKGILGPTDVVEVRWQQGGGGSYMSISLYTTTSTPIVAGALTPSSVIACAGDIPPQSITTSTATSGCTIMTYQWQQSTVSGIAGFNNISGATSATLTPNFALSGTTYVRRIDTDACGQSVTLSGVVFTVTGTSPGDTSIYGNNIWNSYGYNCYTGGTGAQVALASNFTNYRGYSTIAGLNFNTTTLYASGTQSPSDIPGYQGCSILASQHSTRTKRKGFPAGQYNILLSYDDPGAVLVNNVLVYSAACCATNANTGWSGNLGATDVVEIRQSQNNGGSYYGITFNPTAVTGLTAVGSIATSQVVCYSASGINITSVSPATSGGCFIYYQWQSSTTPGFTASIVTLTGFGTNTSINNLGPFTQTTYIRRLAVDACGSGAASNIITISVPGLVSPGSINSVAGVCAGTAPTTITGATLPSGGIGTYTYLWQYSTDNISWNSIASATGVNYPQPFAISVPTYFRRSVTSGSCTTTATSSILVSINAVTTVTSQPSNVTVCGNSTALLSATTGGTSPVLIWQISTSGGVYFNLANNQVISSATVSGVASNVLSVAGSNAGLSGFLFRLLVNGNCGSNITSTSVNINIGGPAVSTQPSNANICIGSNATFSLAISGTATNFQWFESIDNGLTYNLIANNATYSGVSTQMLTVSGLSASMTGYRYLCNVTTSCNTFGTSTASGILTVSGVISNNTISGTSPICSGTSTTLIGTTATGGGGVYSYLWQSSPDGSVWTNITTATSINYTTPSLSVATYYKRIITSGSGCTDSNNSLQISLTTATSIITQPSAINVCLNGTGIFSTTTTGFGLSYSWVESISGWNPVNTAAGFYSGYNTPSLTITGAPSSITGRQFKCVISGICGVVTTNGVTITINNPPAIVTNPSGYITCASSTSPFFTVSASGTSLTYLWQVSTDNGFSYSYVSGVSPYSWSPDSRVTPTLLFGANGGSIPISYNGYVYRAEVSGTCGPKAYSSGAVLTVTSGISGNSIASPTQTLCQGTPSSLTGTVAPILTGGDGSYINKWQSSPDNSTWTDINPTVTSANFAPPFLSSTTYYRRIVSSFNCAASTSNTATISITPGTSVTGSPVNASICENSNVSFSVVATGSSLSYQWQYATSTISGGNWQNLTPVVAGVAISGTTSATMTVISTPPSFNGYLFRAIVSGNCAPLQATSTGVSLTTNPAPTIVQNPTNSAACINGNIQLNTSATGTGVIVYNWKESTGAGFNLLTDGGVYSNTSTTSINLSNIPSSYSGRQYMAIAAIGGCTISSTGANITINQPTSITSSLTRTMCSASFLNYSITASVFGSTTSWNRPTVSGISNAAGSGSTASIVEQLFNSTSLPVNVFYNLNPVGPMPTTCSGTGAVLTVTVYPGAAGNWIGSLNSDWFNTGNWCGGTVPASSISASIFSGTLFYPAITTSGANVLDLSIGSGSFLSVTGSNTLGVYGNFTNNGSFVPSNSSTLNFLSSSLTQTISGASINTFANLSVSNTSSGGVILGNTSKILGTLTLSSNTKLVTTGYPLVLISSFITGTARIASIPSNSTIVGNITVQRYIPAKLAYRFLASPVSGATISNWQGNMFITGNGAGSDLGSSVPVVATYTESLPGDQNTGFQSLKSGTSTTLQAGLGYRVFVRGDRSIVLTSNYAPTPTTLSVTGAPNIGTVTLPVTYTSTSGGTVSTDGWNLVGNPYASQIDWNLITTGGANFQHIDNAMYILDPASTSSTTAGSYLAYVNGVAAGPGAGSPNPNLISSSQSFFVHANAANPVLKLTENVKSSGTANDHFRDEEIPNLLRISIMGESGDDNTVIRFSEDASDLFDSHTDAYKLTNSFISISTKPVIGLNLAINTMKVLNNSPKIVPVSISTSRLGAHKFVINNTGTFDPNIKIELIDKYLNTINTITEDFTYDFTTTSIAGSTGDSRFEVVFTPQYGDVMASILPDSLISQNPDLKWSINGNWYTNTQIASHLPVGNYTITFSTITGWYTPAPQEITVNINAITSLTGIYVLKPKIGSILVKLTPNSIEKGRIKTQWRINKGAWQNSNMQIDSLPVGNYTISFNDLAGYFKPAEVNIFISEGIITTLTSAYIVADTTDQTVILNPSDLPSETILGINTSSITSNIINFDSTSVNSFIISASPNPVGDNLLTIRLKANNNEKVFLEVYNQAGKVVYSNFIRLAGTSIITETKLDILRDFPIGIYLFKFVQNEQVILKKIAK